MSAFRRLVAGAAWLAGALALGLVVAATGIVDVSATSGHAPLIEPLLKFAMQRSVAFHGRNVEEPNLDPAEFVPLGAAHFHDGCGHCHGVPGRRANPVYASSLPSPPPLDSRIAGFGDREIFRIIRHGLKYTGMPAWGGEGRDDEVWAVVAFVRKLPELDESAYNRLAYGNAPIPDLRDSTRVAWDVEALREASCDRCHDVPGGAPASRYVPRLGGQSAEYLEAALRQFRDGDRESGFMEAAAVNLSDHAIGALARYYADLDSPLAPATAAESLIAAGRQVAVVGVPERDVPACDACHAAGRLAAYPRLAGLAAEYQIAQLDLWRRGGRSGTEAGRTMSVIAARLRPGEIAAVAAYYEALPPASALQARNGRPGERR